MNDAFLQGFIKRAQEQGIPEHNAYELAKQAGFFSNVGNFANDMFVKPATGIFRDGGRAITAFGEGRFGDGFKATGSALGNAALTGMNFIPAGGLGSMAIRGGLRGAGMLAGKVAPRVINGVRSMQGAKPLAMGGKAMAGRVGQVTAPINRAGQGFANFQQRAGGAVMNGLDSGAARLQGMGQNIMSRFGRAPGGPIQPNAVSNTFGRVIQPLTHMQNTGQRSLAGSALQFGGRTAPATVGMMGYANNSGQRQQQQMIDDSEADFEYI